MLAIWDHPRFQAIGAGRPEAAFVKLVLGVCALPLLAALWAGDGFGVALVIALNAGLRLLFPSSYVPLTQAQPGVLSNPIFARALATVAELIFVHYQARYLGLPPFSWLFWLTVVAECCSWAAVRFQSEVFNSMEDLFWTLAQTIAFLAAPEPARYVVCLPFVLYMVFLHHPRMLQRPHLPIFRINPGVQVAPNEADALSWQVPSLLLMPPAFALFVLG